MSSRLLETLASRMRELRNGSKFKAGSMPLRSAPMLPILFAAKTTSRDRSRWVSLFSQTQFGHLPPVLSCFYIVQQARKIKKCKIVSWDWLEDSLLAKRPRRAGEFLLKGRIKVKAKAKATKKESRDANIMTGGRCTSCSYLHSMQADSCSWSRTLRERLR